MFWKKSDYQESDYNKMQERADILYDSMGNAPLMSSVEINRVVPQLGEIAKFSKWQFTPQSELQEKIYSYLQSEPEFEDNLEEPYQTEPQEDLQSNSQQRANARKQVQQKHQLKNKAKYSLQPMLNSLKKQISQQRAETKLLTKLNPKSLNLRTKIKPLPILSSLKEPEPLMIPKLQQKITKKLTQLENKFDHLEQPPTYLQAGVDHIDNKTLKWGAKYLFGKEATENLLMSKKDHYLDTYYAKKRVIYDNYKQALPLLRNYFKDKITGQIGADKLNKTKGIYFNENDESSIELAKALVTNSSFIKILENNLKLLENGGYINSSISFSDKNFHNAIGLADIINMHINQNGDLDLYVADVYDFNDDKNSSDLVKIGRDRQERGEIIPYFYAYHVIIPTNLKFKELK